MKIQDHPDYVEHVGIAVGMQAVIVTDRETGTAKGCGIIRLRWPIG